MEASKKLFEKYLKNFNGVKKFKITDEIKIKAKELYDKADKTEFLAIINGKKL